MSKRVDCSSCKHMYDCDYTYLGGCTNGKEWEEDGDNEKPFIVNVTKDRGKEDLINWA